VHAARADGAPRGQRHAAEVDEEEVPRAARAGAALRLSLLARLHGFAGVVFTAALAPVPAVVCCRRPSGS
jgi:hypothetical protein